MNQEASPQKRQKVVALKYDREKQAAPKVLAKGQGAVAEKILETARKNGIPLYKDPELIEILSQLDVGLEIQPELYQAVAEVLIFIYKANQKKMNKNSKKPLMTLPAKTIFSKP
jgi:flagellar biosynthesis protein